MRRTGGADHLLVAVPATAHGDWEVDGGEGRFEGTQGLITSNVFINDAEDVTDNQFGVIFVAVRGGAS